MPITFHYFLKAEHRLVAILGEHPLREGATEGVTRLLKERTANRVAFEDIAVYLVDEEMFRAESVKFLQDERSLPLMAAGFLHYNANFNALIDWIVVVEVDAPHNLLIVVHASELQLSIDKDTFIYSLERHGKLYN